MLYSFKIVFPTRQVLLTSAVAVVKPTFNAIAAGIAVKAPTRAFSWLRADTTAFKFKTLC